jgi:ComF family protein
MRIITHLLDFLYPPRHSITIEALGAEVRATEYAPGMVALLPYRAPLVRRSIVEAKFRNNRSAQNVLGALLADYLAEASDPFALIPLPLSEARQNERGYNQTERIAEAAGARVPVRLLPTALIRTRTTLPQTSLSGRERLRNVRNAFRATGPLPDTHTYIVFDDVATTGATLREAVHALSAAGARRIIGLSLAH